MEQRPNPWKTFEPVGIPYACFPECPNWVKKSPAFFYQNPWNSNRKRTPTTICQFPKIKTSHLSVVMDKVEKTGEIDEKESGDKQNQRNQQNIIHG
jgi:hypothetical protein